MTFKDFFAKATGSDTPFPYQEVYATAPELFELIHAPTGSGKTAAAVLGWLWRYFHSGKATPRRLIYCLPMRVLVEQIRDEARKWTAARAPCQQIRLLCSAPMVKVPERLASMYVGLTDEPDRRKREHGNPSDWRQCAFSSEAQARAWEKRMLAQGYRGVPGGDGWRYGYTVHLQTAYQAVIRFLELGGLASKLLLHASRRGPIEVRGISFLAFRQNPLPRSSDRGPLNRAFWEELGFEFSRSSDGSTEIVL
jgi:hypothetical protein